VSDSNKHNSSSKPKGQRTPRKVKGRAEQALLEMEEKYLTLFEAIPQGAIYFDSNGRILSANPAARNMLKLNFEQIQGKGYLNPEWKLMREDGSELPGEEHPVNLALRTGRRIEAFVLVMHNPFSQFHQWLSINAYPLFRNGAKEPHGVISTFEDITNIKTTETSLRENEVKYRQFLHQSSEGIALLDESGRVIEWNAALEKLTGILYPQALGQHFMDIQLKLASSPVTAEMHERQKRETEAALQTGQAQFLNTILEVPFRHLNGEIRTIHQLTFPIKTGKGFQIGLLAHDISERKAAEEKLRSSEARLSAIFQSSPAAITLSNTRDNTLLDINDAFVNLFGYTKEEAVGQTLGSLNMWVDLEDLQKNLRPLSAETSLRDLGVKLRSKDGSIHDVLLSSEIISSTLRITLGHDITERKQVENRMAAMALRYQTLLETSTDGIHILNSQGDVVEANSAFCEMLGYTQEEVLKLNVADWDVLWSREELLEKIKVLIDQPDLFETVHRRKDGSYLHIEISAVGVRLGGQNYLYAAARDITERKRAEEALRESEARWQFALEGAGDGVWDWNAQTNQVFYSDQWKAMLGFEPHEIGNVLSEWDQRIHPDDKDYVYAEIEKHDSGRVPIYTSEHRLQCKDGSYIWILDRGKVVSRSEDGKPLRIIGTHKDITVRKLAEQKLRESEALFATVFNANPTAIGIVRLRDQHFIHINPAFEALTGYTLAEMKEITSRELNLWVEPEQRNFYFQTLQAGQSLHNFEHKLRRKDGRILDIILSAERINLAGEECILTAGENITEIRQIYEELKIKQAQLAEAAQMARLGYWEFDFAAGLFTFNDQFYKMLRTSARREGGYQMSAQQYTERFLLPEDADLIQREIQKSLRAPTPDYMSEIDHRVLFGDETSGYMHVHIRLRLDAEGRVVKTYGVNQDITEHKQAEEKIRTSEAKLQAILDASPVPNALNDEDLKITYLNRAFVEAFGYTLEDIPTLEDWWPLAYPDPEYRLWVSKTWQERLEKARWTKADFLPMEVNIQCKDGTSKTVIASVSPLSAKFEGNHLVILYDITQRKLAEENLRASEERFRAVSEEASDMIFTVSSNGIVTYLNDQAARPYGALPEALIGRHLSGLFPPEIYKDHWNHLKQVFETGVSMHAESLDRFPTGEVWQDTWLVPLRDKDGQITAVLGNSRDITQRMVVEESLRLSEQKFRTLAENTPNVIFQCRNDARYTFLYVNDAVENLTGYIKEEFLENELTFFDLYHPDDLKNIPTVTAATQGALNRAPYHITYRIRHRSGEIRWVDEWGAGILNPNGEVDFLQGIMVDITERKKIEQELQAQRDFATQILDLMGQGLTVTNSEGVFEFVNPAYASLFGYTPEELIGKMPKDVTAPEDHSTLQEQKHKRETGISSTYESRLVRKDGSIAPVLISGVARKNPTGGYAGAIAVITDLGELKRIETELRNAKAALEKALTHEQELSHTDELTGIHNRRYLLELTERKLAVAYRYQQPLAVLMFDIDHFKNVNDSYGHACGDQVLKAVTQITRNELREADIFGRYGGEEFVLLLPMTNAQQAFTLAERIRLQVADLRVPSEKGEVSVTLSVGVIDLNHTAARETLEDIFRRADIAMYAAKATGRNCTVVLDSDWRK